MTTAANITKSEKKAMPNLQTQTFFTNSWPILNVLADTHFSFLSFLTPHSLCLPAAFFCTSWF